MESLAFAYIDVALEGAKVVCEGNNIYPQIWKEKMDLAELTQFCLTPKTWKRT